MNSVELAVVNAFRAMPDEEILAIAKQHIGGAVAPQSLEAIPRAPQPARVRKPSAAAPEAAKPSVRKAVPRSRQAQAKADKPAKSGGDKRTAEALASQMQDILHAVTATPGQGAEQLAKELKLASKALTLPMKKLIAERKIRAEGQKRATKYFPA